MKHASMGLPYIFRRLRLGPQKREEKLDKAKNAVIEEMRAKLAGMGVDPQGVVVTFGTSRRARRDSGSRLLVKYRSPNGETWSGRGFAPSWLKSLEEQGHNREEFLVREEEP